MARTITQIQNAIIADVNTNVPQLTSTSGTAVWKLWTYIVASSIAIFEQVLDAAKVIFEGIAVSSVVGNSQWWVAQIKAFQYSATNPQVISLNSQFVPTYPVIDTTLQIVTQVAVVVGSNRQIKIKTAQGLPGSLAPLTAPELVALNSYISVIQPAGNNVQAVSLVSDKIMVAATIYYNGQYPLATITANVQTAITNYLAALDFNGYVVVSAIEDAIQAVAGVEDVLITATQGRADGVSYSGGTGFNRTYLTEAGYCIPETTGGHTLNDTLTYIVQ